MRVNEENLPVESEGPVVTGPVQANLPDNRTAQDNVNQGTIAIESQRAIAEAQASLILAQRFPRDPVACYAAVMESCRRPEFAQDAFFKFPRGGESVEGVTVRFAEELARCWRNIDFGLRELSRDSEKSEMQAYAWDKESNVRSEQNFTNPHYREVKRSMVRLTSERDIYELNANMGARRKRAMILAVLPSYLVKDAIAECKKTLAGKNDVPLIDRVNKMVSQFGKYGVTPGQIEKRLGRKVESMTTEDFVEYISVFNSLKDGATKPSEWFDAAPEASELDGKLKEMAGDKKGEE